MVTPVDRLFIMLPFFLKVIKEKIFGIDVDSMNGEGILTINFTHD